MQIKRIDVLPLKLGLIPDLAGNLYRSAHQSQVTLYRLHLANGVIGYGENVGPADDISDFLGRNAVSGLIDIKHSGVQMAGYDAVGKALGVPAHVLMGRQVRLAGFCRSFSSAPGRTCPGSDMSHFTLRTSALKYLSQGNCRLDDVLSLYYGQST